MHKIYLDTCVPLRPFNDIILESLEEANPPDPEWLNPRIQKSKDLITLIGQGKLQWSTSEYFFREFIGITKHNRKNKEAIEQSDELHELLREIIKQARRASPCIEASEDIEKDADELVYLSAPHHPDFRLEFIDSCHIITSFRAQVSKFLTYDHNSILNRHSNFVSEQGKEFNPSFSCEDPVDSDFP